MHRIWPGRPLWLWGVWWGLILAGAATWFLAHPAAAAPAVETPLTWLSASDATEAYPSDAACRVCHQQSDEQILFPSGESLPAGVNLADLDQSAHGHAAGAPLPCTACHEGPHYQFPHQPVTAPDVASYQLTQSATCQRCHQPHLTSHAAPEMENGVSCTACHGAHTVRPAATWATEEAVGVCLACHDAAGVERNTPAYLTSVIQAGLLAAHQTDNPYCLACHTQPGLTLNFPNGDTLSLTLSEETLHASVHGLNNPWQPLACVDCHQSYRFPHEPVIATSEREYNLTHYQLCAACHEQNYDLALDSAHGSALAEGNSEAAVCTDCHGAHDTPPPDEPRQRISHTCQQCHASIFEEYAASVHGDALLSESNPDVPTCIECHGVHNIEDPTTSLFRIRSPRLCASCHADADLMAQYDISTDVFSTYVADFHGTTVTLFEQQDPTVETNKAVCFDCHGVHNIKRPDDPAAGIKANLLITCQECHPNATANFPDAWTSHFEPSLQHNPLIYLVNLFYQIVIPLTLSFFGLLVISDIYRRVRLRLRS